MSVPRTQPCAQVSSRVRLDSTLLMEVAQARLAVPGLQPTLPRRLESKMREISVGGTLSLRHTHLKALSAFTLTIALLHSSHAQTYKVGSDSQAKPQQDDKKKTSPQKTLGWGSNIENARLARAAEEAIKSGNYAAAVDYAQRAADGAPGDPHL